jgi:hypothetical protein
MRWVLALAVVVVVAAIVAVVRDDRPRPAPVSFPASVVRAEATRGCASRVESGGRRERPVRVRRGDLATPTVIVLGLRSATDFDPAAAARPGRGDAMLKAPLSVRAGPPVIVELAPRGRARLALDFDRAEWGRDGRTLRAGHGQGAVRFVPCPPEEPRFSGPGTVGPWTQWNGGLLVARAGCATLRVWRGGQPVERADVAVGVPARRCR